MLVYVVRNRVNGKVYVGKTQLTLTRRWSVHVSNASRGVNTYFYAALRKYGASCFDVSLVSSHADTPKQLNEQERYFIAKYRASEREFGYNLTQGGEGMIPNETTRKKMSDAHQGKPGPRLGSRPSEATRNKISATLKAKLAAGTLTVPTTKGRKFSSETKEKMSNSRKGKPSYWKGKTLPRTMVESMHSWH
jgi:group I intron endonuclease